MLNDSPLLKIALATCRHHPGFVANDDQPVLDELLSRGHDAHLLPWDDENTDWSSFDCVLIRTPWDYMTRLEEFLAWCRVVDGCSVLLNPLGVIEHNLEKTYMRDLERAGVPIVATRWIEPSAPDVRESLGAIVDEWAQVVIKPHVGGGASGMLRASRTTMNEAVAHVAQLLGAGPVLVQPFLESITSAGETSLVMIDGAFSHAVRKVPKEGEIRVQIEFGGTYTPVEPTTAQIDVAERAMAALGEGCLYGRVDLVEPEPGRPALIELELVEPELFFPFVDHAAHRYCDALLARLSRQEA